MPQAYLVQVGSVMVDHGFDGFVVSLAFPGLFISTSL